jgi:hypothetical protein
MVKGLECIDQVNDFCPLRRSFETNTWGFKYASVLRPHALFIGKLLPKLRGIVVKSTWLKALRSFEMLLNSRRVVTFDETCVVISAAVINLTRIRGFDNYQYTLDPVLLHKLLQHCIYESDFTRVIIVVHVVR